MQKHVFFDARHVSESTQERDAALPARTHAGAGCTAHSQARQPPRQLVALINPIDGPSASGSLLLAANRTQAEAGARQRMSQRGSWSPAGLYVQAQPRAAPVRARDKTLQALRA